MHLLVLRPAVGVRVRQTHGYSGCQGNFFLHEITEGERKAREKQKYPLVMDHACLCSTSLTRLINPPLIPSLTGFHAAG